MFYFTGRSQQPIYEENRTSQQLLNSIDEDIKSYPQLEMSPSTQELSNILSSSKIQSLLRAHDVVVQDWKSVQDVAMIANQSQVSQVQHNSHDSGFNEPNKNSTQSHENSTPVENGHINHLHQTPNNLNTPQSPATHIRKIQFYKHNDEPLGITLKMTENGECVIARVFHGGLIHRQGTLHAGDQIREINNYPVSNKTIEELQSLLKSLRGNISFKVVPALNQTQVSPEKPTANLISTAEQNGGPVTYLKCLFDYDPIKDDLIPCAEAGMRFSCGDIIQITIKDEPNWWQARSIRLAEEPTSSPGHGTAGLVPSPQFQQWRMSCEHVAKKLSPHDQKASQNKSWFGWSGSNQKSALNSPHTPFALSNHSNFQQNSQQEPIEIQTYEEVVRVPNFRRKCLVLIGAHGVGRRHIKSALIEKYSENFGYPIPFTSRPCRRDEQPGQHFNFCGHDEMLMDIRQNKYLEYGSHDGALYGTKMSSIQEIIATGKLRQV